MGKEKKLSTRKKVGYSVAIGVSALLLIFVFCGRFFGSTFFKGVANFFVGSLGMSFYGIMIAVITACSFALAGKKINVPKKYIVHFFLLFAEVVMLVHMFSTLIVYDNVSGNYAKYIEYIYNYYEGFPTFGGVVFGTIVFGLQRGLTIYGATALLVALLAVSVYFIGDFFYSYATNKLQLVHTSNHEDEVTPEATPGVAEPVEEEDKQAYAMRVLFPHQYGTGEPAKQTYESKDIFDTAAQSNLDDIQPTPKKSAQNDAFDILFNGKPIESGDERTNSANDAKNYVGDVQPNEMANNGGYYGAPLNDDAEPLPWSINESPKKSKTAANEKSNAKSAVTGKSAEPKITREDSRRSSTKATIREDSDGGLWIVPAEPKKEDEVEQKSETDTIVDPVDVFANDERNTFEEPVNSNGNPTKDSPTVAQRSIFDVDESDDAQPDSAKSGDGDFAPFEPVKYVTTELSGEEKPSYAEPDDKIASTEQPEIAENAMVDSPATDDEPIPTDDRELVAVETGKAVKGGIQMGYDFQTQQDVREAEQKVHFYPPYVKPPFDLLEEAVAVEDNEQENRERAAQQIVKKLSIFGIGVKSEGQIVGPSVTRFQFSVTSEKTRMSDFRPYSADIKACLEAKDDIIIQAPIPGTNLVGIEVANKVTRTVKLRDLLESTEFQQSDAKLAFIIGQEIDGKILVGDLSKLPHLLVAGTTGSGKSVFLDSMIISLMYKYGPEYLRFIMVDPKLVELSRFNGIPHMLTSETITTQNEALASMDYLISEMEARYQLFKQNGVVNIVSYNAKINPKITQRLPYLVLVVDELSDLMMVCQKQFESKLLKLAQKSRAAGIHMVLATQRPDVKTITGTIKTNFSCRVALKVASPQDSVTILSGGGAEKLLGRGDMLYLGEGQASPTRAQGTFVTEREIADFVEYMKNSNEVYFDENISKQIFSADDGQSEEQTKDSHTGGDEEEKCDPYCRKALRFWLERQNGRASIASIQRSLKIGFNRAGRIMDYLQRMGYVEEQPSNESTRPVQVLVTLDDLDKIFPDLED